MEEFIAFANENNHFNDSTREFIKKTHLLIKRFMMFEKAFQRFQDFDLAGDTGLCRGLPLHHGHPQRALMTWHQAF